MDFKEKSFLSNRICCGGYHAEVGNMVVFLNFALTTAEKALCDFAYKVGIEEAEEKGLPSEEQALKDYIANGRWDPNLDEEVETLNNEIKKHKERYLSYLFQTKSREILEKKIKEAQSKILKILNRKALLLSQGTQEAIANERRNRCKYLYMTKNKAGENLPEEIVLSRDFLRPLEEIIISNSLNSEQVREIARTAPWRMMWNASGKRAKDIFGYPLSECSDEQLEVCYWSGFYDSVYDAHDRPDDVVINNDIAIDSWYAAKIAESDRESKRNSLGKNVDRHKEIFVVSDKENAQKVYEMNDPATRKAMQIRDKVLKESGSISEADLLKKGGKANAEIFVDRKDGRK